MERGDTVIDDEGASCWAPSSRGRPDQLPGADHSAPQLQTRRGCGFPAPGTSGILTGDASYAAQGQCIFTDLSRESMASVGDEVITTGLGGVYPPDLLVGRIVSIEPEASGTSVIAVIQPDADVLGVKQAFIITDY